MSASRLASAVLTFPFARPGGFEPPLTGLEPVVLPLHQGRLALGRGPELLLIKLTLVPAGMQGPPLAAGRRVEDLAGLIALV